MTVLTRYALNSIQMVITSGLDTYEVTEIINNKDKFRAFAKTDWFAFTKSYLKLSIK